MYQVPLSSLDSATLRQRARYCREIATTIADKSIYERLIMMAVDYETSLQARDERNLTTLGRASKHDPSCGECVPAISRLS